MSSLNSYFTLILPKSTSFSITKFSSFIFCGYFSFLLFLCALCFALNALPFVSSYICLAVVYISRNSMFFFSVIVYFPFAIYSLPLVYNVESSFLFIYIDVRYYRMRFLSPRLCLSGSDILSVLRQ